MKKIAYLLLALPFALALASCEKKDVEFSAKDAVGDRAQFQIIYVEPITVSAANAIDSIYVNGKLYLSLNGATGALAVNSVKPYPTGFYVADPGSVRLTFYRGADGDGKAKIVYDKNVTLNKGKQEVYIYGLDKDPVVLSHQYPYPAHPKATSQATFNTDSLVSYRLVNFFFESPGVPYEGKVQYQYSNNSGSSYTAGDWYNLGEPIGFGESTQRVFAIVHKSAFNSSGYQTLRFRCVDPEGNTITRTTDYWTSYIGRYNTHVLRGCRTGSPSAGYTQIINNVQ